MVDELLDIQLEFEEKLAGAEEQTALDLQNQKADLEEKHSEQINGLNLDLDKHKAAIQKLSDKLTKSQEQIALAN